MATKGLKEGVPLRIPAVILLMSFVIGTVGILFFNSQKDKIENEKQDELAAIASLKINQIASWRREHIRDGYLIEGLATRNQLITNILENKGPPGLGTELYERMKIVISDYDYQSMLLVDENGIVRLVYPPSENEPSSYTYQPYEINTSEIGLSDLHFSDDLPGKVHLDLRIQVFGSRGNTNVRIGTLVLRIDPEIILYPLIQSWPTPSKTSETLLIRPENDSVLFLNELRHKKNTALKLRLPLRNDLPASRAVQGYEGMFEGIDYRAVPVISYLKKIPNSSWFMVAKVDKKEIYASLSGILLFTSIIAFLLIFLFSVSMIYFLRSQRIRHLQEVNATKDKFFSIISHDLRSPFTGISSLASLLVEEVQMNQMTHTNISSIRKIAGMIRYSSTNALELLTNLTDWFSLNTNRLVYSPGDTDLVSIINDVIDLMNITAVQKSITIRETVPSQLRVYADKEMISLVLRNLISNSVKFTNPGGNIHITAIKKGQEIRVDVSDTGIGIEEEKINKLFLPDEDVSTPGTQNERGTGLGLLLVKEFISLHGGQVFVESKVGLSTRFSFTLPAT